MEICVKILAIVALMCLVSALPVEDQQQVNEPQIDLLSVDNSPLTDSSADDLSRDKRHYGGYGKFIIYSIINSKL